MIERVLHKLRHFRLLSAAEEDGLRRAMTPPRAFRAGHELIRQFSSPHESTLLVEGIAGRRVLLQGGDEQLTALQVPGDFIDLHGFVLRRLDHSVVGLTSGVTVSVPHAALQDLTDRFPRLTRALWFLTTADAAIHRQWLTLLGRRDAAGRLAHLLCELWVRLDDVSLTEGRTFRLPIRQADLANALGLSTVHMNRVIQEFRARGLIEWRSGLVEILDWAGLVATGEFEPTYLQVSP